MLLVRTEASRSSPRQATAQQGLRSTERVAQRVPHQARDHPEAGRLRLAADDQGHPDRRARQDRAGHRAGRCDLAAALPVREPHPVQALLPAALPVEPVVRLATAREQPEARPEQVAQPFAVAAAERPVVLAAESALTSAVAQVQALPPVAEAVPDEQPEAAQQQAAEAEVLPSEPVAAEVVAGAVLPDVAGAVVLQPAEAAAVQDAQLEAEQQAVAVVAGQPSAPAEAVVRQPEVAAEAQDARPAAERAAWAAPVQPSAAASVAVPEDPCCRQVALARR